MKTKTIATLVVSVTLFILSNKNAHSQGLTIPHSDEGLLHPLSNDLLIPYTAEELATPPVGEIRKLRLRVVKSTKSALQAALASVPPVDQVNPNYSIALSAMQKVESVISDRQQNQLFTLIEDIIVLNEAANVETNPSFVKSAAEALSQLKTSIIHEIAAYVVSQNATIPADKLSLFLRAFTVGSFIEVGDWEGTVIPFSDIEMMILDPAAVVTLMKAQPWQYAERFIGRATATEVFDQYKPTGDGLEILKIKYSANQITIDSKWNELAAWVETQRAANP